MAVRVGGTRPNSKPVMRVSAGAKALAYAKVGWSPLTRELVAAEAQALRRLELDPPASFSAPELLHTGEWRGLAVTAVAPVAGGRIEARPEPPAEATAELARGAGVHRVRLEAGEWWRRLRERIERTDAAPQRALAERTAAAQNRENRPLRMFRSGNDPVSTAGTVTDLCRKGLPYPASPGTNPAPESRPNPGLPAGIRRELGDRSCAHCVG